MKLQREYWHDENGTELVFTRDETSRLVELILPGKIDQDRELVFLQRVCDRRGVAIGSAVEVFRHPIEMQPVSSGRKSVGRFWLPESMARVQISKLFIRIESNSEPSKHDGESDVE